jgi:hypothetical protein
LLEKYRNLSDLIVKEAASYLIYDTASCIIVGVGIIR